MNPKERTRRLPVLEHATLKEPRCGSLDGQHTQCYGSWMGPMERDICEDSHVIGSLQGCVSPPSQDGRGQDSEVTNLSLGVGPPLLPSRLVRGV